MGPFVFVDHIGPAALHRIEQIKQPWRVTTALGKRLMQLRIGINARQQSIQKGKRRIVVEIEC